MRKGGGGARVRVTAAATTFTGPPRARAEFMPICLSDELCWFLKAPWQYAFERYGALLSGAIKPNGAQIS